MASRFQKKTAPKLPSIPGTTPSLFNFQLLTSTGISGLDHLVGGGFPIGTVCLLENNPSLKSHFDNGESGQNYSQLIVQYFLAEGAFFAHKLFIAKNVLDNVQIPAIVQSDTRTAESQSKSEQMKIAWRYENQSPSKEEIGNQENRSHHFNLNKTIPASELTSILSTWNLTSQLTENNAYVDLFKNISNACADFKIQPGSPPTNVLRLGLFDLGHTLFCDGSGHDETPLFTFLYRLRSLARTHFVVIVACLSADFHARHSYGGPVHQQVLELADISIALTSFDKEERTKGAFKEHHGMIELTKASPLNCLQNASNIHNVKVKHLFKSLRTKFSISPMHLPPDMGQDEEQDKSKSPNTLDF